MWSGLDVTWDERISDEVRVYLVLDVYPTGHCNNDCGEQWCQRFTKLLSLQVPERFKDFGTIREHDMGLVQCYERLIEIDKATSQPMRRSGDAPQNVLLQRQSFVGPLFLLKFSGLIPRLPCHAKHENDGYR